MGTFINILFIIVVSYYALKLIGRFLFPWILKRMLNKMQQRFGNQFHQQQEAQNKHKQNEGKVTIHYQQNSKANSKSSKGDYVDFEEVKN